MGKNKEEVTAAAMRAKETADEEYQKIAHAAGAAATRFAAAPAAKETVPAAK